MRSNVNMNSERGFALMSAALISVLLTGGLAFTDDPGVGRTLHPERWWQVPH